MVAVLRPFLVNGALGGFAHQRHLNGAVSGFGHHHRKSGGLADFGHHHHLNGAFDGFRQISHKVMVESFDSDRHLSGGWQPISRAAS